MRSSGPAIISHPGPTVSACTERELIDRIRQRLAPPPPWVSVGIGDDAAVVEVERNRLEVLSVDAVVEGVHFDRSLSPAAAIGHRALAVNLSDLAAMGATPRLALLSMALPGEFPLADFDGIADGVAALAAATSTHVVGGNLTRTPGPLTIEITVVGTVKPRRALTRGGAREGDELYVTGTIGAARTGLEILRAAHPTAMHQTHAVYESCVARYQRPEARLRVGVLLARNRVASACVDLSDGLADAVRQIADGSSVGVEIQADLLPVDPGARAWFESRGADPERSALEAGDDYELLFAVRPRLRRRLNAIARLFDVPITRVGVCTAGRGATLLRTDGLVSRAIDLPRGYGHFR